MRRTFAVIRTRGPAWRAGRPLESQADEARARLAEDPWTRNGLLRVSRVAPWTLRLGSLAG